MPQTNPHYPPTGEQEHVIDRRKLRWGPYTIIVSVDQSGRLLDIEEISNNKNFYDPSTFPGHATIFDLDEFFPDEPDE